VVDDVSFEIRPGQFTGFIGPNGAGKSTTMRMLVGLDRPDAGTATVWGVPYADLKDPNAKGGRADRCQVLPRHPYGAQPPAHAGGRWRHQSRTHNQVISKMPDHPWLPSVNT
jgi:ABC-type glutathione transport system ATPase component